MAFSSVSDFRPHHIVSEISCLGRFLRTFEAFKSEHDGYLLLLFKKASGHTYVVVYLPLSLHPCQNEVFVIVITVEQKAVVDEPIGGGGKITKSAGLMERYSRLSRKGRTWG